MTIAEDVQLMLTGNRGMLRFEPTIPVAGALVELVLAGRLSSIAKTGLFPDPGGRLLTVVDTEPTGERILDAALAGLARRRKPWRVERAILAIRVEVMTALYESLEFRGLARASGEAGSYKGTIVILDAEQVETRRSVLALARTLPDTVKDARLGAVVDLLRSGGNLYRGETGLHPRLTRDWYPAEVTSTIEAILRGEGLLKESQ